jgi:phage portal protein BeeE
MAFPILSKLFPAKVQTKSRGDIYVTVLPSIKQPEFYTDFLHHTPSVQDYNIIQNFEQIPDIFTVENYIANKCASVPVKVVKKSGKDAENSELWKLIKNPNPFQNWKALTKLHFLYKGVLGNSYLYAIKPDGMQLTTKLWNIPADKVGIVLLYDKSLPAWMNELAPKGYKVTIAGREYFLDTQMILHDKDSSLRYDDGSYCFGISKYVPGEKISRELRAIYDAKTSIIERRGAVGIITNESEMPDKDQTEAVQKKLADDYGLKGDQNKFIVTTEKLKYLQMGLGIAELQLIENAKWNMAKVCQLNMIDPVVFSTEGSTFANKETAVKDMMNKVIKPKVDEFYENLNFLVGDYGGEKIIPDWSQVDELQADRKVLTDMLAIQIEHAVITPKEAYEQIYGEITSTNEDEIPPDEYFMKSGVNSVNEPEPPEPDVIDPELVRQLAEENQNSNGNGNGKAKSISV